MEIMRLKGRIDSTAWRITVLLALSLFSANLASAQDKGSVNPEPLPPLANPNDPATPAKELFGRKATPALLAAHTIGFYSKGCIAGAKALPLDGDTWQVMRQSRNRNWGHPNLVRFLERLAHQAPKAGWRGLLVGDMSQPRGGPMHTGHFSHQVGLDADIWLTPMPDRKLTRQEREEMMATVVVAADGRDVDPSVWTPAHAATIKAAAKDPQVSRIFVNPAIKKALCRDDRPRPRVAQKSAGVVWARLPLPCADLLPNGQSRLHIGAADCCGRWLQRQGSRPVVLGCRPASEAVVHPTQGKASTENGRPACRLPPSAVGTIAHPNADTAAGAAADPSLSFDGQSCCRQHCHATV
jgi:penicillin-insensitive murein DD-endopeptidase